MSSNTNTQNPLSDRGPVRRRRLAFAILLPLATVAAAFGADQLSAASSSASVSTARIHHHHQDRHGHGHRMDPRLQSAAMLATAGYQDVEAAEAAGYASSLDTLGCFQNPAEGGMGLHYIKAELMDASVDITKPEALVYELGRNGEPVALVAHEYIVPTEVWTSRKPPRLFGMDFHRHSTLPLWVLHTWLWKDNPGGMFEDWNPAVRLCPAGVPIFGADAEENSAGS
jgi:hypothetical protein